jgi:hypothetical protein
MQRSRRSSRYIDEITLNYSLLLLTFSFSLLITDCNLWWNCLDITSSSQVHLVNLKKTFKTKTRIYIGWVFVFQQRRGSM